MFNYYYQAHIRVYSSLFLSTTNSIFNYTLRPVFIIALLLRAILGVSRPYFLLTWARLELNLLMFLRVALGIGLRAGEGIKYFIIQRAASGGILASLILLSVSETEVVHKLIAIFLLIKLGAAPFHRWFIRMVAASPWGVLVLLASIQKVIPLFIVRFLGLELGLVIILTRLVRAAGRIGQAKLKPLLGYSSVFRVG